MFSTKDLVAGEEIITIPHHTALTQGNGELNFPSLASKLADVRNENTQKPQRGNILKRLWNRIRRRQSNDAMGLDAVPDNVGYYWKEELTAYALAALEQDHPWAPWIKQWQRNDPMQALIEKGTWTSDNLVYTDFYPDGISESVHTAMSDFHKMAPDIAEFKVMAAVGIRLEIVDDYLSQYRNKVPASASQFSVAVSRAVGLTKEVSAIVPFHDMINHSSQTNVEMRVNDDGSFSIVASKNIVKDTELLLRYMDVNEEGSWDEDKATWLLVQWGIPSSPLEFVAHEGNESKASTESVMKA